jgi:hypothetical protein
LPEISAKKANLTDKPNLWHSKQELELPPKSDAGNEEDLFSPPLAKAFGQTGCRLALTNPEYFGPA